MGPSCRPTLISNVTNAVMEDVRAWQSRPLSAVYPILYFDALFVKSRQEGPVKNKAVYGAGTLAEAEEALERFSENWDAKYPAINPSWWADWERLTVFFDYSPEIRKVIYTTNAIESLNYSLRRMLKTRGSFPNDDAILKILYLAINRVSKKWTMPIRNWKAALNQFVILFGDRVPV